MNQNEDFLRLMDPLPADIQRRKDAGDIEGALRLIEKVLAEGKQPELEPRLRAEAHRLPLIERNYPYTREEAISLFREEWPEFTEAQFDALVEGRRIDWRYVRGEMRFHDSFLGSCRLYPAEVPGLKPKEKDPAERNEVLERMKAEGSVTSEITIKATIKTRTPAGGKKVRAWLPFPAACPQQSGIQLVSATGGYVLAPEDAKARTIYWESDSRDSFEVVYKYRHKAVYVDPLALPCDEVQPDFDTGEQLPHIAFTPYLRELAARITKDCRGPAEKAWAIYDYVTTNVDYRFQPAYVLLDDIADSCAKELRGDCGVMALLFITLCRISGIPAKWQSGLAVEPWSGPGCHDWCMFYVAPYGWMFADPSFGSAARRQGEPWRQKFYFGNLDPWRMVANSAFQAPLTPPDPCWRHDPYDNQLGEMTLDGVGLSSREMARNLELVTFSYL